jgi:putative ABC transport system ATP-binding protein
MEAVVCEHVAKSYVTGSTTVHALSDITLTVRLGELFMLVGPSGCGKTTLISIMAGILSQDSGVCKVFGKDLRSLHGSELIRFRGTHVGFVFQSYNLIPTLTCEENAAVPLLIQGVARRRALDTAAEILDTVGLASKRRSYPSELSGGQQQRVAIARALVHEPKLIVCDEPTAALDHHTGEQIMEIFRKSVVEKDRTLVIVTHDSRIFHFADRIARLDDGALVEISESVSS